MFLHVSEARYLHDYVIWLKFTDGAEGEGFGEVESTLFVFVVDGVDALDAELDFVAAAASGGEIFGSASVREDLPDIEAVVNDERLRIL